MFFIRGETGHRQTFFDNQRRSAELFPVPVRCQTYSVVVVRVLYKHQTEIVYFRSTPYHPESVVSMLQIPTPSFLFDHPFSIAKCNYRTRSSAKKSISSTASFWHSAAFWAPQVFEVDKCFICFRWAECETWIPARLVPTTGLVDNLVSDKQEVISNV